MPLTEDEVMKRDAKRDIGAELLAAIREVKSGNHGAVYKILKLHSTFEKRHQQKARHPPGF